MIQVWSMLVMSCLALGAALMAAWVFLQGIRKHNGLFVSLVLLLCIVIAWHTWALLGDVRVLMGHDRWMRPADSLIVRVVTMLVPVVLLWNLRSKR